MLCGGIWPALVTPLTHSGAVDVAATERLIDCLVAAGVKGLYVCGGTGEGVLLKASTRRELARAAISAAAGRVPVMVHVGSVNQDEAVELACDACAAGADAVSSVPPFYYGYRFGAIKAHYERLADASQRPLYLYYVPASTVSVSPEQLLELCAIEGVAGFKYTSHDLVYLTTVLTKRSEVTNIVSGPDELLLPCLALGVDGAIGTTYNLMPRLDIDIYESVRAGDLATAQRLQRSANQVIDALRPYAVIPATKATLGMLGLPVGQACRPLSQLDGEKVGDLERDLKAAGYFDLLDRPACYPRLGDSMRGRLA